jgi:maltooligosyltrehalose trehalohydrolase
VVNEGVAMDAGRRQGAAPLPIDVWAPLAQRVDIEWAPVVPEPTSASRPRREPMTASSDGWWRWEGPASWQTGAAASTDGEKGEDASGNGGDGGDGAASGTALDYAFVLDGAEPALPDPRSAWQPHGVHGPSRTFDPSAFAWTDEEWLGPRSGAGVLGSVVYELHLGTFTPEGTLDAALTRLDHLVALGVDVVELMPVAAFPGRWGWGYDGVDLWAVHDG